MHLFPAGPQRTAILNLGVIDSGGRRSAITGPGAGLMQDAAIAGVPQGLLLAEAPTLVHLVRVQGGKMPLGFYHPVSRGLTGILEDPYTDPKRQADDFLHGRSFAFQCTEIAGSQRSTAENTGL